MAGILESALLLSLGTVSVGKKAAENMLREALKQNNVGDGESDTLIKALTAEGEKARKALAGTSSTLQKSVDDLILKRLAALSPCHNRVEELEKRIEELEKKLSGQTTGTGEEAPKA